MEQAEYMSFKVERVTNQKGSTYGYVVLATIVIGLWVTLVHRSRRPVLEWGFGIVLWVLCYSTSTFFVMTAASILLLAILWIGGAPKQPYHEAKDTNQWLLLYRGSLLLSTCFYIFAVDFDFFHPQNMKTETWGVSLMDTGPGTFVCTAGCAAGLQMARYGRPYTRLFRRILLIFVPGLIRVALVMYTGYPEHVSEYGVHWNFFFTTAITQLFSVALSKHSLFPPIVALSFLIGQLALTHSLQDYLLSPDRRSFIEANKEGLLSLPGYFAIYAGSWWLGAMVPSYKHRRDYYVWLSVTLWILTGLFEFFVQESSRKLCNATYVLFSWSLWLICCGVSFHFPAASTDTVFHAAGKYHFEIFIIANLITGFMNMALQIALLSLLPSIMFSGGYYMCLWWYARTRCGFPVKIIHNVRE